jgi:hypothetical protein
MRVDVCTLPGQARLASFAMIMGLHRNARRRARQPRQQDELGGEHVHEKQRDCSCRQDNGRHRKSALQRATGQFHRRDLPRHAESTQRDPNVSTTGGPKWTLDSAPGHSRRVTSAAPPITQAER